MSRMILLISITFCMFAMQIFAGTYSGGDGSSGNPYQISNTDDLIELSNTSGDWGSYFEQTANISFDSDETQVDWDGDGTADWDAQDQLGFNPIGNSGTNFTGEYDGQNNTISNLYIDKSSLYTGFFGGINGGVLENLGLINIDINGGVYTGGFSGNIAYSTVENCYTTGSVNGGAYTGGFAGGVSYSTITNSYNSADVTGASFYAAGFIGHHAQSTVRRCFNIGDVSSSSNYASGFFGANFNSTVSNSYTLGNVNRTSGSGTNFSAFSSLTSNSTIENSYSTGSVTYDSGTDPADRGFVIDIYGNNTFTDNFFDSEASNQSSGTGATAKTTSEMKNIETFTDETTVGLDNAWDFADNPNDDAANNDYWTINSIDNNGYPTLKWQGYANGILPILSTNNIQIIGDSKAKTGGTITDGGEAAITQKGVCWNTSGTPTISDNFTNEGSGDSEYESIMNGLTVNTQYYVRAYATNSYGTGYGDEKTFIYTAIPTLPEWGLIILGSLLAFFAVRKMLV